MNYSPIIVFVYNRPDHSFRTLKALSENIYASESDLFIYCDGPRDNATSEQIKKIENTRNVAHSIKGFKSITIIESKNNKGLAASIIEGVSSIIKKYGTVIVIEDDIVTGKYFLKYMNNSLERYRNQKKIWHITGWHNQRNGGDPTKCFFYPLMDCWSWGTWADRWEYFKKNPQELIKKYTNKDIWNINVEGLVPSKWGQILGNYTGVVNTWAIFWYAIIIEKQGLCLAPEISLVRNIGFDNTGEHSSSKENYEISNNIDHEISSFPNELEIDLIQYKVIKDDYKKRFRKERIIYKLKKIIPKGIKKLVKSVWKKRK